MTITYPLSMPSDPKPSVVRLVDTNTVGYSASPFTLETQVHKFEGEAWGLEIQIDNLTPDEARPWQAFLSALRGRFGRFYFAPTLLGTPQGVGGVNAKVNGANQTGETLATDGWPASSLVLRAGDLLSIENRLYRNLTNATTDGSGLVTLDIWPRARNHPDNAAIVTTNPTGIFRLSENAVVTYDAPRTAHFDISITAEEAL